MDGLIRGDLISSVIARPSGRRNLVMRLLRRCTPRSDSNSVIARPTGRCNLVMRLLRCAHSDSNSVIARPSGRCNLLMRLLRRFTPHSDSNGVVIARPSGLRNLLMRLLRRYTPRSDSNSVIARPSGRCNLVCMRYPSRSLLGIERASIRHASYGT